MKQLLAWGFGPFFLSQLDLDDLSSDSPAVGRVIAHSHGDLLLLTEGGPRPAVLSGRLRDRAEPLAVGDWVRVRPDTLSAEGPALAVSALERKTCFQRRDPGGGRQVIAANVDTVFITASLGEAPNLRRVERSVVAVAAAGAEPVVLLTKADLSADPAAAVRRVASTVPGRAVLAISATEAAEGLGSLARWLEPGQTVALTGPSGAGKSTLVNALMGEAVQDTSAVRAADQKGRHTTTSRRLFLRPGGGLLLDTPGMRELGLSDDAEGLDAAFADIVVLTSRCRWRDCAHDGEPGCAIAEALESGGLDPARLASFHKLAREGAYEARRGDLAAQSAERRRWKQIHLQAEARQRLRERQRG